MKPWIKRTLIGMTSVTVLLGGLAACAHRGDHSQHGWSDERVAEMRDKAVERVSDRLALNPQQRQKLQVLADQVVAQRKAVRGEADNPRGEMAALIAGEKFDRTGASRILEQKRAAVQTHAPQLLEAFADFYDSLDPRQQQYMRDKLQRHAHGWWGRG